jgi:hypothetical protein
MIILTFQKDGLNVEELKQLLTSFINGEYEVDDESSPEEIYVEIADNQNNIRSFTNYLDRESVDYELDYVDPAENDECYFDEEDYLPEESILDEVF